MVSPLPPAATQAPPSANVNVDTSPPPAVDTVKRAAVSAFRLASASPGEAVSIATRGLAVALSVTS